MKVIDSTPVFFRFWIWFYSDAIKTIWQIIETYLLKLFDGFSIGLLATTLFDPWKRDVLFTGKMALDERVRVFFWNLFSRVIGFFVRSIVLVIGVLVLSGVFLLGILLIFIWALFPIIVLYLIWYSLYLLTI